MTKILLILLLVLLIGAVVISCSEKPPLRGMTHAPASPTPVLLSRARPALTFDLGKDLPLLARGWCTVRPATHESEPGSARVWLALYGHEKGCVVTAVCDGENRWEWLSGEHTAFPVLRSMRQDMGRRTLFENLMVLDRSQDPFCADREDGVCLVYRARLLQELDTTEVIVEYHEDLAGDLVQDIAFANDYLKPLVNGWLNEKGIVSIQEGGSSYYRLYCGDIFLGVVARKETGGWSIVALKDRENL